jgi:hypothetical protein
MEPLDRSAIIGLLQDLDRELGQLGVRGQVYVVGGAAISLAYDERRATMDVDAVFAPTSEIRTAARRVADDHGLEPDWLNDAAKSFVPGDDPERVNVYEGANLSVAVASPSLLLAMKIFSARADRDLEDIKFLYPLAGCRTADDGLDLVADAYPEGVIPARAQFFLEEMFPRRDMERGGPDLGR